MINPVRPLSLFQAKRVPARKAQFCCPQNPAKHLATAGFRDIAEEGKLPQDDIGGEVGLYKGINLVIQSR